MVCTFAKRNGCKHRQMLQKCAAQPAAAFETRRKLYKPEWLFYNIKVIKPKAQRCFWPKGRRHTGKNAGKSCGRALCFKENSMETFLIRTKIFQGTDALQQLSDLSIQKAFLICDPFLVQSHLIDQVTQVLDEAKISWSLYDKVVPDPTVASVSAGVAEILKVRPDTMIAVGGGSAIDTGKAVGYIYAKTAGVGRLRCVVIPTTSGTGSEVTSFAVITDPEAERKFPLVDDAMLPDVALLAPQLTVSVPPKVTADTGMDVLTHAIEAYVSLNATDYTDALAEKAAMMVFQNLSRVVKDGSDMKLRTKMQNASCIAGMAFNDAGLGLCHGMAHALGECVHLPHGRANAILLPHIIEYNAQKDERARKRYAALAALLDLSRYNDTVAVNSLVRLVRELLHQVGIAPKLEEDAQKRLLAELDSVVKAALADRCTATNPCQPSPAQVREIYQKLCTPQRL